MSLLDGFFADLILPPRILGPFLDNPYGVLAIFEKFGSLAGWVAKESLKCCALYRGRFFGRSLGTVRLASNFAWVNHDEIPPI